MGLLASLMAVSPDSARRAADLGVVGVIRDRLAAAQAAVSGEIDVTPDDLRLAQDLAAPPYDGIAYVPNGDGTISLYRSDPAPPGYTITTVRAAE